MSSLLGSIWMVLRIYVSGPSGEQALELLADSCEMDVERVDALLGAGMSAAQRKISIASQAITHPREAVRQARELYQKDLETSQQCDAPLPSERRIKASDEEVLLELIEAGLVADVLERLDSLRSRVSRLNEHSITVPQGWRHLETYFEEAHLCYLLGFNRAAAVLCRAVLEACLDSKSRPVPKPEAVTSRTRGKRPRKPGGHQNLSSLIKRFFPRGNGNRMAEDIKDNGDCAIHNPENFSEEKVAENLLNLRTILEDMLQKKAATVH